jgi:hypothetical protein
MVDDEGSTFQETCGEMRNAEVEMRSAGKVLSAELATRSEGGGVAEARSVEVGVSSREELRNLKRGQSLPLRGTGPTAELELSPRRYHVFARAQERDAPSTIGQTPSDQLWTYVAPIHRKRDAIAVSAGLVESGLAVEAQVCVIAQSPGPRAGKVIVIRSAPAIQTATREDVDLPPTASVGGKCL